MQNTVIKEHRPKNLTISRAREANLADNFLAFPAAAFLASDRRQAKARHVTTRQGSPRGGTPGGFRSGEYRVPRSRQRRNNAISAAAESSGGYAEIGLAGFLPAKSTRTVQREPVQTVRPLRGERICGKVAGRLSNTSLCISCSLFLSPSFFLPPLAPPSPSSSPFVPPASLSAPSCFPPGPLLLPSWPLPAPLMAPSWPFPVDELASS